MDNKQFATAIHVMLSLSMNKEDSLVSSTELAQSVNTNPVVIRRILGKLQKAQLIETIKGQYGGVRIKADANKITLNDIYQAVQNKQLISTSERKIQKNCPISRCMQNVMCGIATGVESATTSYLSSVKLVSLKKKVE